MWREPAQRRRDRKIFDEELDEFLPAKILDFHVHVFPEGLCAPDDPFSAAGHPLQKYDLDDLHSDLREALPGRDVCAVCFGVPNPKYDCARNNRYLAEHCDAERFFALRLLDPRRDTPQSVRAEIEAGLFCGFKPYPKFVRRPEQSEVEIREMLPAWSMELADAFGLIIMLHLPRKGRLADPVNQDQLVRLAERYPNAKIVVAHIGRAYFLKNVVGSLERLKVLPNIYFDLAMLNHWEVLAYTFGQVPAERILFGSDIPIALAPGKSVEINDQYTYVTPVPWELSICDEGGRIEFTSFLNEQLRAIKKAVQQAHLGADFVRKIFFENGTRLLSRA